MLFAHFHLSSAVNAIVAIALSLTSLNIIAAILAKNISAKRYTEFSGVAWPTEAPLARLCCLEAMQKADGSGRWRCSLVGTENAARFAEVDAGL